MKGKGSYFLLIAIGFSLAMVMSFFPYKPKIKGKEGVLNSTVLHSNDTPSVKTAVDLVKNNSNPMQGIRMLKEIAEKEPSNTEALSYLALFSLQSNQTEKAIQRFEEVIEVDSNNIQALYFLIGLYADQNKKERAKFYFEKFKDVNTDKQLLESVSEKVDQILTIEKN